MQLQPSSICLAEVKSAESQNVLTFLNADYDLFKCGALIPVVVFFLTPMHTQENWSQSACLAVKLNIVTANLPFCNFSSLAASPELVLVEQSQTPAHTHF